MTEKQIKEKIEQLTKKALQYLSGYHEWEDLNNIEQDFSRIIGKIIKN